MSLIQFKGIYHYIKKDTLGEDFKILQPTDFCSVPLKVPNVSESEPVVAIGDDVNVGTLIAKPSSRFGTNIYSPVKGKVLNIFNKLNSKGEHIKHILIMTDKENSATDDLPVIDVVNDVNLLERLKESGIIDTLSNMPAYLKYVFSGSKTYNQLLIAMDSTDPNSSVNEILAKFHLEEVINGAKYFMNITNAQRVTFVFNESNYKLATALYDHIKENKKNYEFKIKFIPNKYPFDNPYFLARLVGKKKINKNTNFLDAGIAIETAESCFNFCRAVEFGKPVTHKIVSVGGDNILRKGNYLVPIGTAYEQVLKQAGIEDDDAEVNLINGSLLSGRSECSSDLSVDFVTNSLVLMKHESYIKQKEYPCISCGKCARVCPMLLNPMLLDQAYIDKDYDKLEKESVQSCIECGCCSFVCPSKRFLCQRIAAGKYYNKKKKGVTQWESLLFQAIHLYIAVMMLIKCFCM